MVARSEGTDAVRRPDDPVGEKQLRGMRDSRWKWGFGIASKCIDPWVKKQINRCQPYPGDVVQH